MVQPQPWDFEAVEEIRSTQKLQLYRWTYGQKQMLNVLSTIIPQTKGILLYYSVYMLSEYLLQRNYTLMKNLEA